jgi:hypothetical protein
MAHQKNQGLDRYRLTPFFVPAGVRRVHGIEPGDDRRGRFHRDHHPPEAAILAVGAVTRRPIAVGDEVRIASILKATLAVDHRVADGAQAGFFLQEFRKLLENLINFLAG